MLKTYRDQALAMEPNEELEHFITTDFSFNIPEPFAPDEWWEHCYTGPLFHSLAMLASSETAVRLVEREMMLSSQ